MNFDRTLRLENSNLQHGDYNDRVYLMKLSDKDNKDELLDTIIDLAQNRSYGKIFTKVKSGDSELLMERSFECEATVPGLYNGKEDGKFYSLFLDEKRRQVNTRQISQNINLALDRKGRNLACESFNIVELDATFVDNIIKIYRDVFDSYPFPIFDKEYILKSIENNVRIFAVIEKGEILALASCEIDYELNNVEMTDFATPVEHRGRGLAQALLKFMEEEMIKSGIKTSYTIARSLSVGMNITFSKCNYSYGGTLKKNTNISGGIESMNVWYKKLQKKQSMER